MAAIGLLSSLRAAGLVSRVSICSLHTVPCYTSLRLGQISHPLQQPNSRLSFSRFITHLSQKLNSYSTLTSRLQHGSVVGHAGGARWGPVVVLCRGMMKGSAHKKADRSLLIYVLSITVFMIGAAYAGVPLYRIFCQATGRGGQAVAEKNTSKIESMSPVTDRILTIKFNADVASSMQWNFRPQQTEVRVLPGETALAFYTARNPTDKSIIGISTYNVVPFEAGAYFNKIQCFCFEEQRLNPHEQVDMPVFFYIDPDFAHDPKLEGVDQITLSYTFFESKEGLHLPLPGYLQPHQKQAQA